MIRKLFTRRPARHARPGATAPRTGYRGKHYRDAYPLASHVAVDSAGTTALIEALRASGTSSRLRAGILRDARSIGC